MPKYLVETRATVRRHYEVWADNEKDAEAKSVDATPTFEDDDAEETMAVTELPRERSPFA